MCLPPCTRVVRKHLLSFKLLTTRFSPLGLSSLSGRCECSSPSTTLHIRLILPLLTPAVGVSSLTADCTKTDLQFLQDFFLILVVAQPTPPTYIENSDIDG